MTPRPTEKLLMVPGSLVVASHRIDSVPKGEPSQGWDEEFGSALPQGTVGIILERPSLNRPRQWLVQWVGGKEWWMYSNEIKPFILDK
jgi:hypothetical protein